ncbi:NAD-dependent DNA ligase [Bacteriophage Phobos]|uniref:NAD-dependent DNA ligase n=1 Tax=Bacteriophage Phobos TaxID=2662138 RepID=A0A5Q2UBT6_9CAUD|nr:NAD-dependent DNA ligase [Bacteriophage Phobos]QGH45021.1 NAD-dependent DNA ligase [Bacteriophage Phobos]
MITKLVNRIAAALHTHLTRNPVRMHPKDLEQIVLRLGNIIENPLVRVDTSINPVGMDAEAVKSFIESSKKSGVFYPGTKMRLQPSAADQWPCPGADDARSMQDDINRHAMPPGRFEVGVQEFSNAHNELGFTASLVDSAVRNAGMPAHVNVPAKTPGVSDDFHMQYDISWLHEPEGFEEALERAVALCLAGRLNAKSCLMYLRSEFNRLPGIQERAARWLSPAGLGEIAAARANGLGVPKQFPHDVDLDALARRTKKGLIGDAEDMELLLEHKPHAALADRLPPITSRELPLEGSTFVLTGALESMTRDTAKERVEKLGGIVAGSVSRHPVILVRGTGITSASAKLQKAWYFNHPVISEARFLAILAERDAIQGDTSRIETVCTSTTCEDALARR